MSFLETPMRTDQNPFLRAQIKFEDDSCKVVIHDETAPCNFYIEGRNLFAGTGKCLVFSDVDHDQRRRDFDRMCGMFSADPNSVRIVIDNKVHGWTELAIASMTV